MHALIEDVNSFLLKRNINCVAEENPMCGILELRPSNDSLVIGVTYESFNDLVSEESDRGIVDSFDSLMAYLNVSLSSNRSPNSNLHVLDRWLAIGRLSQKEYEYFQSRYVNGLPSKPAALFMFNVSNIMPEPWFNAGYEVHLVDNGFTPLDMANDDGYIRHNVEIGKDWVPPKADYKFACAFVPCTDVAVSGACRFLGKGPKKFRDAMDLFIIAEDTIKALNVPGFIENPISIFSSYCGKPKYKFDPWEYSAFELRDNYNKKTCLWVYGDFVMPPRNWASPLGPPDKKRIMKLGPSKNRKKIRSLTPRGFAKAVFLSNSKLI